jgi:hypothetical protein
MSKAAKAASVNVNFTGRGIESGIVQPLFFLFGIMQATPLLLGIMQAATSC